MPRWPTICVLLLALAHPAAAAWVGPGQPAAPSVSVGIDPDGATRVTVAVPGYLLESVVIAGRAHARVGLPGHWPSLEQGAPSLPVVPVQLSLPAHGDPRLEIVAQSWREVPTVPVVPSRGNLPRTMLPADAPWVFGPAYSTGGVHPQRAVELGHPYRLGGRRGLGLRINPLRWDADRGVLLVLESLTCTVAVEGSGGANAGAESVAGAAPVADLWRARGLADGSAVKYRRIDTAGRMLVVCPESFADALAPFVQWKRERGITVEILTVEAAGGTVAGIQAAVAARYFAPGGLTYLILAGDRPQVPCYAGQFEGADDDTRYAMVDGDDLYPDLFVSRISARDTVELLTQTVKFIRYERDPDPDGSWYELAAGAASNLGLPTDAQRADWLRDDLLGWTFTAVDRIYEPEATGEMITAALNEGRSLLNYLGHGSGSSWANPLFSIGHVKALANGWRNPWVLDVSCANGRFSDDECFAEAWLRSGSPTAPQGAVAMYASSTTTPWVPPTVMQAEAIDLLSSGQADELGAIYQHGIMKVLDLYPGAIGLQLVEQYNIFGDCSLQVRTARPQALAVAHPGRLAVGATEYPVAAGVAGARVALTSGGVLRGTAVTDATGFARVPLSVPALETGLVVLTVTGRNLLPHREQIPVTRPLTALVEPAALTVAEAAAVSYTPTVHDPSVTEVEVRLVGYGVEPWSTSGPADRPLVLPEIAPAYGEDLALEVRDAATGVMLLRTTIPVDGAVDFSAPAITGGVPAIGMSGEMAPGEPGTVVGRAGEAGLALHLSGCGLDTLFASAADSVVAVVRPDSVGTVVAALLKDGYRIEVATIPVVAAKGFLGGVVRDGANDGLPVPGAAVRIWPAGTARTEPPLIDAVSDGQGLWRHDEELPVGTYDLVVERFGYRDHDLPTPLLFGENTWETVLAAAPRAVMSGSVTAAAGGAALAANLELRLPLDRRQVAAINTNPATGSFASSPLPLGPYLAVVTSPGFLPLTVAIELDESGSIGALALARPTASVLVLDGNRPATAGTDLPVKLDKNGGTLAPAYATEPSRSALTMISSLLTMGYAATYEPLSMTEPTAWPGHDLVILACGDNPAPLAAGLRDALRARAATGGLLVEGGEVVSAHRDDPDFLDRVLGVAAWAGDRVDTVGADAVPHPLAEIPAPLFDPFNVQARGYADGEAMLPTAAATAAARWSDGAPAVIARDQDPNPQAGQAVYFGFTFDRSDVRWRDRLLQNAVEWLTGGEPAAAVLTVQVTDASGAPVPGASVAAEPGGHLVWSDAAGLARLTGLGAGDYRCWIGAPGHLSLARVETLDGLTAVARSVGLVAARDTALCREVTAPVPDGGAAGLLASLTMADLGPVGEVVVSAAVEHSYVGDLALELVSPLGSVVPLRLADGRPGTDLVQTFAGAAARVGDLRALVGEPSAGIWSLRVVDNVPTDQGSLVSWCLELSTARPAPPPPEVPPAAVAVLGNRPNPFNPTTTVACAVPKPGRVIVSVYDLRGRRVRVLLDEEMAAGVHDVSWDGRDAAGRAAVSGAYVVRISAPGGTAVGKVLLLR